MDGSFAVAGWKKIGGGEERNLMWKSERRESQATTTGKRGERKLRRMRKDRSSSRPAPARSELLVGERSAPA